MHFACLDTEDSVSGQRGAVFSSAALPLDAIINGREQRDVGSQSDLGSHVNLRPTVSWLWQQDFYLHNSNPKAKAICTLPTPTGGAVFTRRHMEEKTQKQEEAAEEEEEEDGERIEPSRKWMKPSVGMNQSRSQSHLDRGVNT